MIATKILSHFTLASLLIAWCSVTSARAAEEPSTAALNPVATPAEISALVAGRLETDFSLRGLNIGVRVDEGVAHLYGTTDNLLTKDRATTLTISVPGVVAVSNDIVVTQAEPTSDAELVTEISERLRNNPVADDASVTVQASDAAVILLGRVASRPQRDLIIAVAKAVPGVISVEDRLQLVYKERRLDSNMLAEIVFNLSWRSWANPTYVKVEVVEGKVTLSGVVGRASIKENVITRAWIAGVQSVDASQLQVNQDYDKAWHSAPDVTQEQIAQAIQQVHSADVFTSDPRHEISAKLHVINGHTVVQLNGTTDNLFARSRAAELAASVVGVDEVHNNLLVLPDATPADYEADLMSKAQRLLRKDPYVKPRDIKLQYQDGSLSIDGRVASNFQKARAEDLLNQLRYIRAIDNNLLVDPNAPDHDYTRYLRATGDEALIWYMPTAASRITDQQLVSRIKETMQEYGLMDQGDIQVSARTGISTLSGTVTSVHAKTLARNIAYGSGARGVVNRLAISSAKN